MRRRHRGAARQVDAPLSAVCRRFGREGESPPERTRRGRWHERLAFRVDRPNGIPKTQVLGSPRVFRSPGFERLAPEPDGPARKEPERRIERLRPGEMPAEPEGLRLQGTAPAVQGFGPIAAGRNRTGSSREEPERDREASAERTRPGTERASARKDRRGRGSASAGSCRADAPDAPAKVRSRGKRELRLQQTSKGETERGFGIVPGAERAGRLRPDRPRRNGGSGRRDADRERHGFGSGAIGRTRRSFGSSLASKGGTANGFGRKPRRRTGSNGLRPRRDGGTPRELAPDADQMGMRTSFGSEAEPARCEDRGASLDPRTGPSERRAFGCPDRRWEAAQAQAEGRDPEGTAGASAPTGPGDGFTRRSRKT
jgi:hypothetical protein